jgi:outer membrane protein
MDNKLDTIDWEVICMQNKKWLLVMVVVFATTILLSGCGGSAIGVVDVEKVMSESPKVKEFREQLNVKAKELSEKLEKEKAGVSAEEFQKRQEAAYGEFLKTKQDLEGQVDATMKQALEEVAKDKKLGVVLFKNGVAQGGTDITDEVIKKIQ